MGICALLGYSISQLEYRDPQNDLLNELENRILKVWIYKALFTSRYTYLAYSENYGNEINTLIGWYLRGDVLESELRRMIEEALLCNPYILSLSDFEVTRKGSLVQCQFAVNTVYGGIEKMQYSYDF